MKPKLFALFIIIASAISCKKDNVTVSLSEPIDLSQVKMNDFKLEEINYLDIDVIHPVITNGAETQHGKIVVVVPPGNNQLKFTPRPSNFTNDKFTVTPGLGVLANFSNGAVVYTITAKSNASKKVHYDVTITESDDVNNEAAVIGFMFEKSKNPALPANITETRIVNDLASTGKIYIFVPVGTDFSQLTPTVHFTGDNLWYHQDENSQSPVLTPYPANGTSIDFAYPNKFYLKVKKGDNVKTYDVIVDVLNPIKFDYNNISTDDVKAGVNKTLQIGTFLNQGNHPISIIGINHVDRVPANLNVVRGIIGTPYGGIEPNKRGDLSAVVNAQTYPAGTYKVTSVFTPAIYHDTDGDDLLQPTSITITSKIVQ